MQNGSAPAIRLLPYLMLAILTLAYQPQAFGQAEQPGGQSDQLTCTKITESKDFPFLASTKGTLTGQIQELKGRLASLPVEIEEALSKDELIKNREELDSLEQKQNKTPEERIKLERLRLLDIQYVDTPKETLEEELKAKRTELDQKESLLQCVEQRISSISK